MHPLFLLLLAPTAALLAAAAPDRLQPGERVPELELADLDGRAHRLADLRGKVVVLEWTSHLCPAVAREHESGVLADSRAALEGVAWWQVDSSWFAPELEEGIRAWRRRLALEGPYLLDPDGEAARAFGATATPELFVVDAQGVLAYRGALHDGALEPIRRNHVVAAARALLAGEEVDVDSSRAEGCSVKFASPSERWTALDYDEDHRAWSLYRGAAEHARAGRFDEALAELERAIGARHPRPMCALAEPAFAGLLADAEARTRLLALLRDHPARGALRLVAPGEPGEAFVLCGTVRDESGRGIAGALVGLYHTDDAGWYYAGSTSGENPRLTGLVRTDRDGRYRVRTVLPGYYGDSSEGLRHVHMDFRAEGFRTHGGHRASLYFDDDPNLVGANRAEIESDGCGIRPRGKNAEGVTLCVYDVVLLRD